MNSLKSLVKQTVIDLLSEEDASPSSGRTQETRQREIAQLDRQIEKAENPEHERIYRNRRRRLTREFIRNNKKR